MATIAIGISKKPSGEYSVDLPVNALAEDGVPPEQGDSVQASFTGTVESVSGTTASIKIDTINGEPVGEEASESPEEEAGEEQQESQGPSGSASGASPGAKLGALAPMGGVAGKAPLRGRMDRAGTDLMRAKLLKGARGRAMPF